MGYIRFPKAIYKNHPQGQHERGKPRQPWIDKRSAVLSFIGTS